MHVYKPNALYIFVNNVNVKNVPSQIRRLNNPHIKIRSKAHVGPIRTYTNHHNRYTA